MRSLHVSGSSGTTGVVFLSHWRSPGDLVSLYFFAHIFISPDRRFCACAILISSISSTERGEVFYGPTDWLGSRDPMTPVRYTRGSPLGLAD
jgi:hypothetical protein